MAAWTNDLRLPRMSRSYTLKARNREVTLRVVGIIDLCGGSLMFLAGLALILVGDWQGVIAVVGSLIVLWAGSMMTWNRVYVSSERLVTMSNRPHRAKRGSSNRLMFAGAISGRSNRFYRSSE